MKNYVAIIRDHSGSMSFLKKSAAQDYNATIAALKTASVESNVDTIVFVIECGVGRNADNRLVVQNSSLTSLSDITAAQYHTDGGATPLFDAVDLAIDSLSKVPDFNDPEVTFTVLTTTDGGENSSNVTGAVLSRKIKQLTMSDRWTFAFRVPFGYGKHLTNFGISEGNILEWEQSSKGMEVAQKANEVALRSLYKSRATGVKFSNTFYTNVAEVKVEEVVSQLQDVGYAVKIFPVSKAENDMQIRDFVESRLNGNPMKKGSAFYELSKTEEKIQDYKWVAIQDKNTGAVYAGHAARKLIGLPLSGDARVRPGDHGQWRIFIQSTSVNRKVKAGTSILYWEGIGVDYKEGPSAR